MQNRDARRTAEYFNHYIDFREKAITRFEQLMAADPDQIARPDAGAFFIFSDRRTMLMAKYSRGYPLNALRHDFPIIITDWEYLRRIDKMGNFTNSLKSGIDDYVDSIGLLSQAYLLEVEQDVLQRMLVCISSEGQDVLFERLVAALLPGTVRKPVSKLLYPKAYQPLYDALDAPAGQQTALMQEFLQNWYKRLRNVAWHDSHKQLDKVSYFGYWCWEAALVVRAFGIDDSSFRDMPHYPKDLADFARASSAS